MNSNFAFFSLHSLVPLTVVLFSQLLLKLNCLLNLYPLISLWMIPDLFSLSDTLQFIKMLFQSSMSLTIGWWTVLKVSLQSFSNFCPWAHILTQSSVSLLPIIVWKNLGLDQKKTLPSGVFFGVLAGVFCYSWEFFIFIFKKKEITLDEKSKIKNLECLMRRTFWKLKDLRFINK